MNASYLKGILIVVGVVAVSTGLMTAYQVYGPPTPPRRFGQDLRDNPFPLGTFRLTERSGKTVTEADLAGDVWVSAFIFTRCPSACPRISSVMKGLQSKFRGSGVRLVSISVDPDYDTPAVLRKYADGLGADPDRWWFLTGKKDEVVDLILHRFYLPAGNNHGADSDTQAMAAGHSPRLVLVDRGNNASGFFDSDDPKAVEELIAKAKRKASWARKLPPINAALNGTCAVLLLVGWSLIMTRNIRGHIVCMISAVAVSSVFLACYLVYHFQVRSVSFEGTGWSKITYLSILLSHTVLAVFGVVPLVSATLIFAIRKQFHRHARIARVTFPIWLYVSITGVVIYWMLYQMPLASPTS